MTCNKQTMWKFGVGLLVIAGLTFIVVPEFHTWFLALSPALLFLLCPLSMIFCMKMMHDQHGQQPDSGLQGKPSGTPSEDADREKIP